MQSICPFLWFNNDAEEAIEFYTSLFPNSRVGAIMRNGDQGPGPAGSILSATFYLDGQEFMALNGGPQFHFTEAVSFMVKCETQQEIDRLWNALTADGGEEQPCGWLKDRFGLSWQITPPILLERMSDKDPVKANRVMQAMMKMKKIIIADIEKAYTGK